MPPPKRITRTWPTRAAALLFTMAGLATAWADKPVVEDPGGAVNAPSTGTVERALAEVRTDQLMRHVNTLADDTLEGRAAGSRGGRAAANYIVSELRRIGVAPRGEGGNYGQDFRQSMRNLIGVIEGSDPNLKRQALVIGAHYDHVGYGTPKNSFGPFGLIHNGADDNASGTAGLLEIAEAIQSLETKPRRTIIIAFWDGEEDGLFGSQHWVENPTWPRDQIVGNLNIDMIGRLGDATNGHKTLEIHGSRTAAGLRKMFCDVNASSSLPLEFPWKLQDDSDHYEFFRRGIPAVMVHTGLHKEYHRPSDDTHLINQKGLTEVTRYCLRLSLHWANLDEAYPFRDGSKSEGETQQVAFESKTRPAPRLGMRWQVVAGPPFELFVDGIVVGSPASKAGLRAGDRLRKIDGQPITSDAFMKQAVAMAPRTIDVIYVREGAERSATVTLDGDPMSLGFAWRFDEAEPASVFVTHVIENGPAHKAGIVAGDRMRIAGENQPDSARTWGEAFSQARELDVVVERLGRLRDARITRGE